MHACSLVPSILQYNLYSVTTAYTFNRKRHRWMHAFNKYFNCSLLNVCQITRSFNLVVFWWDQEENHRKLKKKLHGANLKKKFPLNLFIIQHEWILDSKRGPIRYFVKCEAVYGDEFCIMHTCKLQTRFCSMTHKINKKHLDRLIEVVSQIYIINFSWKDRKTFDDLWMRLLIDASFWILFTVIGLNVVTSLILDGFRQLKVSIFISHTYTASLLSSTKYSRCFYSLFFPGVINLQIVALLEISGSLPIITLSAKLDNL